MTEPETPLPNPTRGPANAWRTALVLATLALAMPVAAQTGPDAGFNNYGVSGLIDMPVATPRPVNEVALTSSYFGEVFRNTGTFQLTPRLSGSFRYTRASRDNFRPLFDRSFALSYNLVREGDVVPSVTVGINDIIGTGIYSAEYVVATKSFGPRLQASAGIGWGRLGGEGAFAARNRDTGQGGELELGNLFTGPTAGFGGIVYRYSDKLTLKAEYSSDPYDSIGSGTVDRRSPLNFAASYRLRPGLDLTGQYLYGSQVGVQLNVTFDPRQRRGLGGGREAAPPPVRVRPLDVAFPPDWDTDAGQRAALTDRAAAVLSREGLALHGLALTRTTATVDLENPTYLEWAQAVGRAARALTGVLPPEVETFVFVPVKAGIPLSRVTVQRRDLEQLEFAFDNAWTSYARARIDDTATLAAPVALRYPRVETEIRPYLTPSLFDPDNPVRVDVGVELAGSAELAPGLRLDGLVRQRLLGNRDSATRPSDSTLPRVRSESNLYAREDLTVPVLTGAYYFRPGETVYGRVTAGYLESQFGGISAEMLWKPVDSRLALGVELNRVRQRDCDQRFGFRDYEVTTGHASLYYAFAGGYDAQIDVGRYLAGDYGATLRLARTYANGWKIGAYATLTDVPFDQFDEGSFDKGIEVTIPTTWLTGQPSRDTPRITLQPILRDGGARLSVDGRLYETVRDAHRAELRDSWGRFWR